MDYKCAHCLKPLGRHYYLFAQCLLLCSLECLSALVISQQLVREDGDVIPIHDETE